MGFERFEQDSCEDGKELMLGDPIAEDLSLGRQRSGKVSSGSYAETEITFPSPGLNPGSWLN